jgi:hypothetical protein
MLILLPLFIIEIIEAGRTRAEEKKTYVSFIDSTPLFDSLVNDLHVNSIQPTLVACTQRSTSSHWRILSKSKTPFTTQLNLCLTHHRKGVSSSTDNAYESTKPGLSGHVYVSAHPAVRDISEYISSNISYFFRRLLKQQLWIDKWVKEWMYLLFFWFSQKVDKRASLAPAPADTRDSFQAASKLQVSSLRCKKARSTHTL